MVPEISIPRLYFMIIEKIRFNMHEQIYLCRFNYPERLPRDLNEIFGSFSIGFK
jgi:hypothetical protein